MRRLREMLRNEVVAWENGGKVHDAALSELNRLLSEHPMRARLTASRKQYWVEFWFPIDRPEDLYAPLAQSAADLLANADRRRVRKCGHCVLHFYDTSKKGTRHWCSMQLCGNRLKVAAYAARRRVRAAK
jgi:predicted RNA-binding Zn ribbon-like protein